MDEDDAFTSAGSKLAFLKATTNEQLKIKSTELKDEDVLFILEDDSRKKTPANKKPKSKKPSPPKIQKPSPEVVAAVEVLSEDNEDDDEKEDEEDICISSDEEENITAVQRRTRKENKNRANYFRLKEMDASFNEHNKILSYLDEAQQQDFVARQKADCFEEEEEVSEGVLNPEMSIKIQWNYGRVEKHNIRKMQTFQAIFRAIAEKEGIPMETIVLEFGDDSKRITSTDTPDDTGITIADIITGYSLKEKVKMQTGSAGNSNLIEIKVQMVDRRANKLSFHIKPDEKLAKLYSLIAEKIEVERDKVKLHFDGDVVEMDQTAEDLDLDGGEVMDCTIIS